MRKSILTILLICSLPVLAWGPKGHRIIAQVAYSYMSDTVIQQVDNLLGKHGMVYYATWADEIKSDTNYAKSYDWHFQDLNSGLTSNELARMQTEYPTHGGNLFRAMDSIYHLLVADNQNKEALCFYVHLISDCFCPMHLAHEKDKGGNLIPVKWFDQPSNLHKVWDEDLIESRGLSYTEYAQYLIDRNLAIPVMNRLDAVTKTYHLTQEIYAYPKKQVSNTYTYIYYWKNSCDYQLFAAGQYLAQQLNHLYQ